MYTFFNYAKVNIFFQIITLKLIYYMIKKIPPIKWKSNLLKVMGIINTILKQTIIKW